MNFLNIVEWYGINEIFKEIKIPTGIDKEILINTILDKCMMNEPMFYDLPILNMKIQNFFLKNYQMFDRMYQACIKEYEIIENYDRKEDLKRTVKEENENVYNSNNENINYVSPYDSNDYQNDSKNSGNENSNRTDNNNMEDISVNRIHGNIGVTTSQQMLQSEIDMRPKLNIYDIISNMFYDEFMIYLM